MFAMVIIDQESLQISSTIPFAFFCQMAVSLLIVLYTQFIHIK